MSEKNRPINGTRLDMGHPFLESDGQLFVSHVGIYLPKSTSHEVTAKTRLVELRGLVKHLDLSFSDLESRVVDYVQKYGDGWKGHNTYRLSCFVRFLDALRPMPELSSEIDKTVGQWFGNEEKLDEAGAYNNEIDFYAKCGIDLPKVETQISLRPGQLLILDNSRVIHGRIGVRRAKEFFNFMWGVESLTHEDIARLRSAVCSDLLMKSG